MSLQVQCQLCSHMKHLSPISRVTVSFLSRAKHPSPAVTIVNVSINGQGLMFDQPVPKGTRLKVMFAFRGETRPLSVVSQVVWCKPKLVRRHTYWAVGLRHIRIKQQDWERYSLRVFEIMINFFALDQRRSAP